MKDLKPRRPDRHLKTECPTCKKLVRNRLLEAHRAMHARKELEGCSFKLDPKDHNRLWLCGRCRETMSFKKKRNHQAICKSVYEKINAELVAKYGPMKAHPLLTAGETPEPGQQTSGAQPLSGSTEEELKAEEAPTRMVQPFLAIKEEPATEPPQQGLDDDI